MKAILEASKRLNGVVDKTPLQYNDTLSETFNAEIYLKREDLQVVRSYKLRGAYNKIAQLSVEDMGRGVVCASAGNHAQGVAFACNKLNISGVIFMPMTTPAQKIGQVKKFGNKWIEIRLEGDTFDDASDAAIQYCTRHKATFVHPFDDDEVIAGQGTIGLEILEQLIAKPDYLILPVGGGGLAAGIISLFEEKSPETKVVCVEPQGAPSLQAALDKGKVTRLESIDKFVDGAAVREVGSRNFDRIHNRIDEVVHCNEGEICSTILRLYNEHGIIVEPAGALSVTALDHLKDKIKGKNVVCIISGGNNDVSRMEEIRERALLFEGRKHYFLIEFPQRPGALKEFVSDVLGEHDDITYFQFSKKNNRENGPAVVGLELNEKDDYNRLLRRLEDRKFNYTYLNDNSLLFSQLVG